MIIFLTATAIWFTLTQLPWGKSKPWFPSDRDLVPYAIANERFLFWINSVMTTMSKPQTSSRLLQLVLHRPRYLLSPEPLKTHIEIGTAHRVISTWIEELLAAGAIVPPETLAAKPTLDDISYPGASRTAGQCYWDDSDMGRFMVSSGSDGIGQAGFLLFLIVTYGYLSSTIVYFVIGLFSSSS